MRKMIVRKMQDCGITPGQMAKCFGVSERTWYYWLADPEKHLTIERFKAVANILGFNEEERRKVWMS